MEAFAGLLQGFDVALKPINLLWGFIGVTLGTFVGVLPGVGPALTVAMLLPLTAQLDPTGALIMFAGIYYGAMFGGSTTTILLNTPGESASIATALEGNKMAKSGRAGPALATCAIGSFVAGTIAVVLLTLLAPVVVEVALKFGPAEYFALMVFAFTTVAAVLGASTTRGLASLFVGLMLGLVGIDSQTGQPRFAFGVPELLDGIDVVVLAVGLFAVGETLYVAAYTSRLPETLEKMSGSIWMSAQDWKRSVPAWLRATAIGFPFGSIPAGGAEIPTFLSYSLEKKLTRYPEEFGNGAIEGVAGPEAANNASATGVLVPLLTLGIPTSATAAILLTAFQNYGIQPGPLLFQIQPDLVWGLIASMYVGNVILLVLNLPLIGIWVKVLTIPRPMLYAGILVFATLYVFGLLGFVMRRFDIPVAPAVIGLILGPLAETQFRRALSISQGDASVFLTQPISAAFLAVTALLVVVPWLVRRRRRHAAM
ncbi:MAG TPA: tripartite tricarboxylate transporter permease, partial [Burkholderiales bacterium]